MKVLIMGLFSTGIMMFSIIVIRGLWTIGAPVTFVYLMYLDIQYQNTIFQWVQIIITNGLLSLIWPVYWLIIVYDKF